MQNEILGGFTQFQRQSHCFLWFKFLVIYPPSHSKRSWKGVFFQTWKHDFAEWRVLFSFPLCFPSFTLLRLLAPCKPSWSSTYFCFIEKKKTSVFRTSSIIYLSFSHFMRGIRQMKFDPKLWISNETLKIFLQGDHTNTLQGLIFMFFN